ncbi:30S ribosomal protein S13 [Candidatus Uhrbacteria bacterium RIFCSPHIGHO2_12_FULL_60_25]|uniref:Small ribosomal subunit protein uS13 n=1 Tax=Candidatus Uhrbacteria bacterium RIFCSPHIGHO2_12_FULL_60_25 TaxID=1802399 RepID=A0A1F7ULD0_9BACT|nr:MAG: 30S ribosomal protein S13 [Candidatus Uhrbacteria bacterium RIFCSPHIGHO2_02_FULL_60_44]OGL79086.1 MAG: 30S ribosomal protein S13 [Candidatus Uhrbacteria bacterium RIFCSPHIGHO2_12_FULL_60_25]
MARIAGVTLPANKRIDIALQYIYGVGITTAMKIIAESGVPANVRVKDLTETQANKLRDIVEKKFKVEGELKREVLGNIKRLKEIGSYRGTRHIRNLPVRGQRTRTNTRTVRGNVRKTMGSGKRSLEKT